MSNDEGGSAQFFRHPLGEFRQPLKITLQPPERNPENAPDLHSSNLFYDKLCQSLKMPKLLLVSKRTSVF